MKNLGKQNEYDTQFVEITINGRPARAMVDTGLEDNIMTKTTMKSLTLGYSSSNAKLRTVNALQTPMCGVVQGVSITLGELQGKTNFTISTL